MDTPTYTDTGAGVVVTWQGETARLVRIIGTVVTAAGYLVTRLTVRNADGTTVTWAVPA